MKHFKRLHKWEQGFKGCKRTYLFLLLTACTASAQVSLDFSGDGLGPGEKVVKPKACNATATAQILKGWRFHTPSFGDWKTWYGSLSSAGIGPYAYYQAAPEYDENLLAGECEAANVDYSASVPSGKDGTPYNPQLLLKTGSCNSQPPYQDAASVACEDLPAYQGDISYYDDHCIIDSLGINGGDNSGGFVSTFHGQTQIQTAIPSDPFLLNATSVKWDPRSLGGPMYMMALAMIQEYLNVDMQFLQSINGKETMFGYVQVGNESAGSISEWQNYNRDDDNTFTPWEIEVPTFGKIVQGYPSFFPKYGLCSARYPDVTQAAACASGDWGTAAAFYLRTPGSTPTKTGPNSPQLANAVLVTALAFYWLYDALIQSTDLCFSDILLNGKDNRLALAALIPGYNRGPNSGFESPLRDKALKNDPQASQKFSPAADDYRTNVFRLLDVFTDASKKSTTCGGKNSIYDESLSFLDVQRFFFGGSANPGTPDMQGDGGLLLHFDLSTVERKGLLADLQCAFDQLKGKAPSTQGKDLISYRYDWLTMLRAVKARLPLRRHPPVQEEYNRWVGTRSVNPMTCAGDINDGQFPELKIKTASRSDTIATAFQVNLTATDNVKVTGVEWTLDTNWAAWMPAINPSSSQYQFKVGSDQSDTFWSVNKGRLWIRATDGCGNSTVQPFDARTVADSSLDFPVTTTAGISATLSVIYPNGSTDRPSAGADSPQNQAQFIPVNAQGTPLAGNQNGKCGPCLSQSNGVFVGPVFRITTSGPVDYHFKIFDNLGVFVARGEGKIEAGDLQSLPRTDDAVGTRYDASIVWTGRTLTGQKVGTGAYIVSAVFSAPAEVTPRVPKKFELKLFGHIRN